MFDIQEQLKLLPEEPGVYLMKNKNDKIIYVGKAVSLKNRVRQYFQSSKNHSSNLNSIAHEFIFSFNISIKVSSFHDKNNIISSIIFLYSSFDTFPVQWNLNLKMQLCIEIK